MQNSSDNLDTSPAVDIAADNVDEADEVPVEKNDVAVARNKEPVLSGSGPAPTAVDPAPHAEQPRPPFCARKSRNSESSGVLVLSLGRSLLHPSQLAPRRKYAIPHIMARYREFLGLPVFIVRKSITFISSRRRV